MMAVGALAAAAPDLLAATGMERTAAFKLMFYAYAVLGLACAAIYLCLPHAHAEQRPPAAPLKESRTVVYKLAALFSLDAFAGGFVRAVSARALALLRVRYVAFGAASIFFFWTTVLSAFFLSRLAAWIAKRIQGSLTPWCSRISHRAFA